jgi:hypothetical protein
MALIANMTLADGQASPVNHTFTAKGVRNAVAKWKDQVGGVVAGMPVITFSLRESTSAAPMTKVTMKVRCPVLETDPSFLVPTVAYENFANIEFAVHQRCTLAERKDLLAYVKNLLATTPVGDSVKDGEAIW